MRTAFAGACLALATTMVAACAPGAPPTSDGPSSAIVSPPIPSITASETSAESESQPPYADRPAAFDDGLDGVELPQVADRATTRYPFSYEMEPWVWNYVDERWGVALYEDRGPERTGAQGPSELYLVSPAGRHFHVATIARLGYLTPRLIRVSLSDRTARVVVQADGYAVSEWIDLVTGELLESDDSRDADPSMYHVTWGPYADGMEIHVSGTALPGGGFEDERWSVWDPVGGDHPLSLPEGVRPRVPRGDYTHDHRHETIQPMFGWGPVYFPDVNEYVAVPALDLQAREWVTVTIRYPLGHQTCGLPDYLRGTETTVLCYDDVPGGATTFTHYRVFTDGTTPPVEVPWSATWHEVLAWEDEGFEVDTHHTGELGYGIEPWTITDPRSGGDVVLVDDIVGELQNPIVLAPSAYVLNCSFVVLGYDQPSGTVFRISGDAIGDSVVTGSLVRYISFAVGFTTDEETPAVRWERQVASQ